jgi:hypothetical protein
MGTKCDECGAVYGANRTHCPKCGTPNPCPVHPQPQPPEAERCRFCRGDERATACDCV